MTFSNGAKDIFRKTAASVAVLGASALLSGCATLPTTSVGTITVASATFNAERDRITGSCVWPSDEQEMTFTTANGDLYQVRLNGPQYADITASIQGGNVEVRAYFDNDSRLLYDAGNGSFEGLTIEQVAPMNGNAAPPSPNALQGKEYAFRIAAQWAQKAVYNDRSYMPRSICPDDIRLRFYEDRGRAPRGHAVPLAPRN